MAKVFIYKDYDLIEEIDRIITDSTNVNGWEEKLNFTRKELRHLQDIISRAVEVTLKDC